MDAAAHYRQLLQLGREEFLASAAPAALVRYRGDVGVAPPELPREFDGNETLPYSWVAGEDQDPAELALYPLAKKAGASFPDRITIGRTSNNDIAVDDTSVSRLHAYVRRNGDAWVVADAGSKNGSWLRGVALEARKEQVLASKSTLRIGEVDLTFYTAADLYVALGGTA